MRKEASRPLGCALAASRAALAGAGTTLAAFELAQRALPFFLLHRGLAGALLLLRARQVALVLRLGLVFRGAGFRQRDGNRLAAAAHLLLAAAALQLAMLVLVHDALDRLLLRPRLLGHFRSSTVRPARDIKRHAENPVPPHPCASALWTAGPRPLHRARC